ncbi:MAG: mechanosensitive ion channel family protein [Candidatus Altiarchaeota archaeon]
MVDFTITINNAWVAAATLVEVLVILSVTFLIAKVVVKVLDRTFRQSSKVLRVDHTQYSFLKHMAKGLIYVLGIAIAIYMIPSLRSLSVSIFAGAGILALVIGFASQQAFSNIVGGIFIAIFEPFRVGDRIKVGKDLVGEVEDITLRHTVIRDFEYRRIIIPNSVISNEVIENSHIVDPKIRKYVEFGISYDSDVDKAMNIIREEAMKHPDYIDNRTKEETEKGEPEVPVRVVGYGDFSVDLRAYVWCHDPIKAFYMNCDLRKTIKARFDKEGIEIPFPYRTIVYKKDIEGINKHKEST